MNRLTDPGSTSDRPEQGGGLRILYLEDNPVDAELTRFALDAGDTAFVLDVETQVAGAFARLNARPEYDLVLSDLSLPDGSGIDLLRRVRELQLPIPVVILTATGDQDAAVAALKAGADDYIVKRQGYLQRLPEALNTAVARFRDEVLRRSRFLRVLYAEDSAFDADLTRRHLAQHAPNIVLELVGHGEEVLERLPADRGEPIDFDVLMLDYNLPGINALEIVKVLGDERGLDIPVVLVTGQGNEEVASNAMRLGISDYLVKNSGYLVQLPSILENAVNRFQIVRDQARLRDSEARFRTIYNGVNDAILLLDPATLGILDANSRASEMFGYGREEAGTLPVEALFPPDHSAPEFDERVRKAMGGDPQVWETPAQAGGGRRFWVEVHVKPLVLQQITGALVVIRDVDDRKRAEERLRQSATVFESTLEGVVITDATGRITAINRAFSSITGYSEAEVLGRTPSILASGKHDADFYRVMWHSIEESGGWQGEIWNRRRNGEIYPQWLSISTVRDESGDLANFVGVFSDVSHIKASEEKLEHLSHYDPLTDLPNRRLLQSRLEHALEQARRHRDHLALLFLDLDRFKDINDGLGHPSGDELLRQLALRLRGRLRDEDTLARVGGDEFVVLIEQLERPEHIASVAQSLLEVFGTPFVLGDREVYVTGSIGISLYPDDASDLTGIMRNADTALYQAKAQGRNTYRFCTEALTRVAYERLSLEGKLHRALEQEEFELFYQPQVAVSDGSVVGMEALLRWHCPGEGLIGPNRFIGLAEETGLILPLGDWVLRTACGQLRRWLDRGGAPTRVAINLSARQFQQPDLEQRVRAALEDAGVPPAGLELELTESLIMTRAEQAIRAIQGLKEQGVHLAVDDFGTGYSSLAYLKRFTVDTLKIDRSFVRDVPEDRNDAAIVATVIAMAKALGIQVAAEGVETQAQLDFLRKHGCDTFQGYLFCPPLPVADLEHRLAAGADIA
jgi:diguanylate cyclase (GGDEF)-like protein/PAS domain S-box-containing protein